MVQETSRCKPYSAAISKVDHRRKVLNEIRDYFQTQKTLTLIKDVTAKMELKQNNIVSNVMSYLNEVHIVIKDHTDQIIDLQHKMVASKQSYGNIKNQIIQADPTPHTNRLRETANKEHTQTENDIVLPIHDKGFANCIPNKTFYPKLLTTHLCKQMKSLGTF